MERLLPTLMHGCLAAALCAQNGTPLITITDAVVDEGAGTVTITYDLSDPENDPCTVSLRASLDWGVTYQASTVQATGDVGANILPGTGRSLIWTYTGIPDIHQVQVMLVADDGNTPDIQMMVDQVDQSEVSDLLNTVSVPRHHTTAMAGLMAVRDTLVNSFTALGFQVNTQNVTHGGATVPNVIGRHPGLYQDTRTYIVDGHYDAVANTQGADDNATAVVGTLIAAKVLGQYRFRKSLRFIGFSFEEQGLIGSGQYVQNGIPAWDQIEGVLNLEMIGYYSDEPNSQEVPTGFDVLFPAAIADLAADEYRGNFLTVVGNTASNPLIAAFQAAADAYVPQLRRIPLSVLGNGLIAPDLRRSDHARFWDAGIKALMLTDGSEYRNNNYHTPADVPATLNMEFLTNCVKATVAAAAALAEPVNAGFDVRPLGQAGTGEHVHAFPCAAWVHPNPARDVLIVHLPDCAPHRVVAELFDLRGNKITGRTLRASPGQGRHELPVHGAVPGTYLLVLRVGDASTTLKVGIER